MGSSHDLGRKDCFPVLWLEIWCGAVNPAVNTPYDVRNEDADLVYLFGEEEEGQVYSWSETFSEENLLLHFVIKLTTTQ